MRPEPDRASLGMGRTARRSECSAYFSSILEKVHDTVLRISFSLAFSL